MSDKELYDAEESYESLLELQDLENLIDHATSEGLLDLVWDIE